MSFKGLLFGFFLSFLPLFILFRALKGKFLFIENPFLRGALLGFALWLAIAAIFYIDARTSFFGILESESGLALFALITSSIHGFITAGLVVGVFSKKFK